MENNRLGNWFFFLEDMDEFPLFFRAQQPFSMFHAAVTVFLLVPTMFFQHVDLKLNKSKTSQLFFVSYTMTL